MPVNMSSFANKKNLKIVCSINDSFLDYRYSAYYAEIQILCCNVYTTFTVLAKKEKKNV